MKHKALNALKPCAFATFWGIQWSCKNNSWTTLQHCEIKHFHVISRAMPAGCKKVVLCFPMQVCLPNRCRIWLSAAILFHNMALLECTLDVLEMISSFIFLKSFKSIYWLFNFPGYFALRSCWWTWPTTQARYYFWLVHFELISDAHDSWKNLLGHARF